MHFADNIHYYERHFELSDFILKNGISDEQYSMILEKPLFTIEDGMILTDTGNNFIDEVNMLSDSGTANLSDYKKILMKYLNVENVKNSYHKDYAEQESE
jgi:hypothetical protein